MVLFVTFILSGLTLGVGTMLAPALPTRQPRIAVSAVFVLALILSGAVFLGALFGWDTLVIDYMWFSMIIGVFLGGTLTIGMSRIEEALAHGENADTGWPGPRTLAAFLTWFMVVLLIVNTLPTPSTYQNLPSTVDFKASNVGATVLLTYFDSQLTANSNQVYRGMLTLMVLLLIWLLYDFSNELDAHETISWGLTLVAPALLIGFDLALILASLFSLGFGFFALRWVQAGYRFEALAASICGAAAILSNPYAGGVMASGYLLLGVVTPVRRWLWGLVSISLLVVLGLLPWLVANG
ncbi:MAG: hypothetical protein H6673_12760 [Anaerolineales bacterium]|nr:hypothetical protein [Anaerolineales bacterium]